MGRTAPLCSGFPGSRPRQQTRGQAVRRPAQRFGNGSEVPYWSTDLEPCVRNRGLAGGGSKKGFVVTGAQVWCSQYLSHGMDLLDVLQETSLMFSGIS